MRDLFARWATRATGATEPESAGDHGGFPGAADVAQRSEAGATRATDTPTAGKHVAHVAQANREGATTSKGREAKQDNDISGMLPTLPMLPTESGKVERCTLADCLELLDDMHASIRADYAPGALALLDTDQDLRRRFDATEARIDELAKVTGGPTEADFHEALADHAAIWREISQRHRAHLERQAERADPMPYLPGSTALAIGISSKCGQVRGSCGTDRK
jgi:hypothetical protein